MLHLQNGMNGLNPNTQTLEMLLKRKNHHNHVLVSMVSKLSVLQVMQIMSDDDFSYLMEYEPDTISSLCNALSVELQEAKEDESISDRRNMC
jgi:hypothetical protein